MRAIWVRARSEMRNHWRALVALCLLAGLPGGFAVAAAIGATRTDTMVDRVVAITKPTDIFYVPDFQETKLRFEDIASIPVVSEAYLMRGFGVMAPTPKNLEVSSPHGTELPHRLFKLLKGRYPDPTRPDEAMITFKTAALFDWHVGMQIPLALIDPSSEDESHPKPGPVVTVRIVGINAAAGDLVGVAGPGLMTTPAFEAKYASRAQTIELDTFKLRRGPADIPAFEQGMRKLGKGRAVLYVEIVSDLAQVKRGFHLQAVALWITCAVLAGVSLLIFGQSIGRQSTLDADEFPALRALGMTRSDLTALGIFRAAIIGLVAAIIATVVAVLLSIATPFGLARIIEPQPGVWTPGWILGAAAAALLVGVVGCAVFPSWRVAAIAQHERTSKGRPSLPARLLGFLSSRPSPVIGARFALERGRGRSAVPVRSSIAAAVIGIVVLLAALSVGVSVKHFAATPRLYGWNWDVVYDSQNAFSFDPGSKELNDLVNDPAISDASVGGYTGATFRLNGIGMDGIALDPVKGHLEPTRLEGRVPTGSDEVAVGRKSLQEAHAHIGSTVKVGIVGQPESKTLSMRVVGVSVFPFDDDTSTVGEGLWMTAAAAKRILPPEVPLSSAVIRFAPGISKTAALKKLKARFEGYFETAQTPGGVKDYKRVSLVPFVLAGVLAALALGTVAHLLLSSIRRRRRDLAILKTIGFEKSQARGAVMWQAGIFMLVVLAIAVPLGFVVGRWTWNVIAGYGGFASAPVVSFVQVGIVCGAALLIAAALAVLPARAAARTPPAVVLRTE